jgi:hypothetical protein
MFGYPFPSGGRTWYRVAAVPDASVSCSRAEGTSPVDVVNARSSHIATPGEGSQRLKMLFPPMKSRLFDRFLAFQPTAKLNLFSELTIMILRKFQSEYFIVSGCGTEITEDTKEKICKRIQNVLNRIV